MAEFFYAKISSVNYKAGTADITLADHENQVVESVPFLNGYYEMPTPGDTVAVLFEGTGQLGKGIILGGVFLSRSRPKESGEGIFYKEFSDGASVKYTPSNGVLEVTAKKLVVKNLEVTGTSKTGKIEASNADVSGDTITNILKYNEIYRR